MPRKKLFDPNELEQAILLYLNKGYSYSTLVEAFGLKVDKKSFRKYVYKYQKWGFNSLLQQRRNHRYSSPFKHEVVKRILGNQLTVIDAMVNYNISSDSTIYSWIKKYTEGKPLTPRGGFPEVYDMKPRKTTFEERLQIVEDYFEHHLSYQEAAQKYQINYSRIYGWVKKYKEFGPDGLRDGRGKGKPESVQTDMEKLIAKNRALELQNKYLQMENDVLKKVKQIESELIAKQEFDK